MFNKLTERVYYMDFVQQGDRPVLALVVGDDYSVILDGGNSKAHAEEFLGYVEKLDIKKPKYLLITHWHWDHVWGMEYMNKTNVVSKKTKEKLDWLKTLSWDDEAIRERVLNNEEIEFCQEHIKIEHPSNDRKMNLPKLDIVFEKKIEFDLGGVIIKMEEANVDHSKDCCIVNICEKEQTTTFLGDAMYMDMYNGPWSYSREKLYPFLDKLLENNSDYYIPAHHNLYNNQEFKAFVDYIKMVGEVTEKTMNEDIAIEKMKAKIGRELNEFELADLKAFIEGDKKLENKIK